MKSLLSDRIQGDFVRCLDVTSFMPFDQTKKTLGASKSLRFFFGYPSVENQPNVAPLIANMGGLLGSPTSHGF